jgi:hypothetical protein
MNPHNDLAAARRRSRLLDAFGQLGINEQADLLELVETWAFRATSASNINIYDARQVMRKLYALAGLENEA